MARQSSAKASTPVRIWSGPLKLFMKILVTGGAGFIGSHLCRFFLKKGYKVRSIDNFSTGYKKNFKDYANNKNFEFLEGDIRNFDFCNSICSNIDIVTHQAALGSVPRSIKDPLTSHQVNVNGFLNMLLASKNNNIKKFIYASSSSVYGDSENLPKIESITGNPMSPYALTKKMNEDYTLIFSNLYNLKTFGLRYFNVFGPYQDPNGPYAAVIPKFIKKLINKKSPVINGDGKFSRDFTYIDNILHFHDLLIKNHNINLKFENFNVACGASTSILELAKEIKNQLILFDNEIKKIKIKFRGEREGDVPHSLASIKKSEEILNYIPKVDFKDGIFKTVEWYWNNKKF